MKSSSVTIQMKATEQFFPVVLFIILQSLLKIRHLVKKCNERVLCTRAFNRLSRLKIVETARQSAVRPLTFYRISFMSLNVRNGKQKFHSAA